MVELLWAGLCCLIVGFYSGNFCGWMFNCGVFVYS